jgi:hypothetical protein
VSRPFLVTSLCLGLTALATWPAVAQPAPSVPSVSQPDSARDRVQRPTDAGQAGRLSPARVAALRNRYHVRQMESVLERAVEHAAELMTHRLHTVSPDVMALAGVPRAQGFRIEGYGLFFAVEVPRLSDSMNWALHVLSERRDEGLLASLRQLADAQTDPALRADLERAMRLVTLQGAVPPSPADGSARQTHGPERAPNRPVAASTTPSPPRANASRSLPQAADVLPPRTPRAARSGASPVTAATLPDDDAAPVAESREVPTATGAVEPPAPDLAVSHPSLAYEDEVKTALVDALLDYSLSLPLAPGEWVTVAARDAGFVAFPEALAEMVTVTLSVRVDDLLEFRSSRISRDEARARVLVREF